MGERSTHQRNEALCIDSSMEGRAGSSNIDANGYLLYFGEMRTSSMRRRLGSIDGNLYPDGTELGCSLCGVP